MGLENRPFVGTWTLNNQELVQHTPDTLIRINGDSALPGCSKCSGKIDLQQFITECSVDAGTEAGSASASFTLVIPFHHTESFARDARYLLHPGLEVQVYSRGYFPVRGLFEHLAEPHLANPLGAADGSADPAPATQTARPRNGAPRASGSASRPKRPGGHHYDVNTVANRPDVPVLEDTLPAVQKSVSIIETLHQYFEQQGYSSVDIRVTGNGGLTDHGHVSGSQHYHGAAVDLVVTYKGGDGKRTEVNRTTVWASITRLQASGHLPAGGTSLYLEGGQEPNADPKWSDVPHVDHRGKNTRWIWEAGNKTRGEREKAWMEALQPVVDALPPPGPQVATWEQNLAGAYPAGTPEEVPQAFRSPVSVTSDSSDFISADYGPSYLEEMGLAGTGVEKTLMHPYYPIFHGVVTEVGYSYSGGFHTISVQCSSKLHFWQYQNMSTNASVFGARPTNSKNRMSMVGHNFTGMHPYEIMYALHYDTAGAAGGVSWALAQKSNQTTVSTIGGESLFSLNLRYWEERFKGRVTRLRMHGATGALFSTMAAAWLSRTSSGELLRVLRNRFNTPKQDSAQKILQQSQLVGLGRKNKRDARAGSIQETSFAARSQGAASKNDPRFEINILEMQAFVSNLGNWGQVNLFESTYESKLDIAQKVCEVTGFEFYQDVDGDFVFKPPMYNLDTSASRVYRIEDIDIISFNASEKEPQVTYMTTKGSHFKNLQGTGTEGEWGVQGQYIDYRLVAQFGWRPGSYETAYFNDPKSMFFSSVNRMDLMNVGMHSATVTIPLRPELRPGYPVYIPSQDCFYYCNSLSHSYSVGGQCTTTLQLVGKRAKFYAPGTPTRAGSADGIGAIDLGDTLLPERPLQVLDEGGKPRLSGFPNVVMALDPTGINPLFFVVGTEAQDITDPQALKQILDKAVHLGVLFDRRVQGEGTVYFMRVGEHAGDAHDDHEGDPQVVAFYLNDIDIQDQGTPKGSLVSTTGVTATRNVNVLAAAIEYENLVSASGEKTDKRRAEIRKLTEQITETTTALSEELAKPLEAARPEDRQNPDKINMLTDKATNLEARLERLTNTLTSEAIAREQKLKDLDGGSAVAFLLDMIERTGAAYRNSADFQGRADLNSSINLLDMLADKKAVFSNGTQPGRYRYYSCSHPDPDQQGPQRLQYDGDNPSRVIALRPEHVEPQNQRQVLQYARDPQPPSSDLPIPEAQLIQATPDIGIRVLNSNPASPKGEVFLTADVMELSFAVQEVQATRAVTTNKATSQVLGLGPAATERISASFAESVQFTDTSSRTIREVYEEVFAILDGHLVEATEGVHTMLSAQSRSLTLQLESLTTPDVVVLWGTQVSTDLTVPSLQYSGSQGTVSIGPQGERATIAQVSNEIAYAMGFNASEQIASYKASLARELLLGGITGADLPPYLARFNEILSALLQVGPLPQYTYRKSKKGLKKTETFSPVFPVSDEQGYTVVGSYRYGRAVDIDPNGVFAQLHQGDVFSLLSKDLVDQILRVFVQQKSIQVPEMTTTERNGVKVTTPTGKSLTIGGDAARSHLNREALKQLRDRHLTDKQILDYGLALQKEGSSLLEFGLANYFSDESKDGVHKVPVVNAAYSLADIDLQHGGNICSCKAAEASVALHAFGSSDFLQIGEQGDQITQWLAGQTALASGPWQQQQAALRGELPERQGSRIVPFVSDLLGGGTTETLRQQRRAFDRNLDNLQQQIDRQQALAAGEDEQPGD